MPEKPLRGAIQNEPGKLSKGSIDLLRVSGIPFEFPTGRQRYVIVETPPMSIGTEKNGGLAYGVAKGKYDWAMVGLDTVLALPDRLRRQVRIVEPDLGFGYCFYVLGVYISQRRSESTLLADRTKFEVQALEDLRPGTKIATKYEHALNRLIREQERRLKRRLGIEAIHEDTPETAPQFSFDDVLMVADIWEHGDTSLQNCIEPRITLFDSKAVLIRRIYRFSEGRERSFETLHEMIKEGLANPERWINPDAQTPNNETNQAVENKPERRFWPLGGLFRSSARVAVISTLLFTLMHSSVILNPWHSRISEEKDLRS